MEEGAAANEDSNNPNNNNPKLSSLRWQILRRALLRRPTFNPESPSEKARLNKVSRRTTSKGFSLIPCHVVINEVGQDSDSKKDSCLCYTLPLSSNKLFLRQRLEDCTDLNDFEVCRKYDIDNTGLVCQWPSEEVLAYYSMSHLGSFRSKRVIELGSGYGLAGLVIAMVADASEVVISDGNPQVVNYIQQNIDANSASFGGTKVKSMLLHWDQNDISDMCGTFDIIVASDCTFFKEFHKSFARTIRCLLKEDGPSEAILFSPKRGDSLNKFLLEVENSGLRFTVTEMYDTEIWSRHQTFIKGEDQSWPNYDPDHCYPLFIKITR